MDKNSFCSLDEYFVVITFWFLLIFSKNCIIIFIIIIMIVGPTDMFTEVNQVFCCYYVTAVAVAAARRWKMPEV